MKKAYLELIKNALNQGLTISVWDGEEWQVKKSTSYQVIKEAIESVELAQIRIRDKKGKMMGWAQIIPDLDPEETVSDYTDSAIMRDLVGDTADN